MKYQPATQPVLVDQDEPITDKQLSALLKEDDRLFLCIRSKKGNPQRGGYFFFIERSEEQWYLYDLERNYEGVFALERLVRFINHVSGRRFDEEILVFCQRVVNLRKD